jgi:citrate synthase
MTNKIYKGLNGVCVDTTELSNVDGINGILTYLGYNVDELLDCNFEEIAYLFFYKHLPNSENLNLFKRQIKRNYCVPQNILNYIKDTGKEDHPMSLLRTSVSMLSSSYTSLHDNSTDNLMNNSIKLVAQVSTICAAICRTNGNKEIISPREDLDFSDNFLYMMFGKQVDSSMVKTLDLSLILHMDHSFNASTFTARLVASTLSDIISSVSAAVGSLKGPLHGGANSAVMKMLLNIGNIDNIDAWVENALSNKYKIMGFGHRVYKVLDPRAKHLKKMSHQWGELTGNTKWFDMSNKLEKLIYDKKKLNANVDFYSASTYYSMGIEPENFTLLFALSRVVGWLSHIHEQLDNNKIIRPKAQYVGEMNKKYNSILQRG